MSKLSKAIAVLGVVAGLGVSALPLSSYAETSNPGTTTASQDATVEVVVDQSISISIEQGSNGTVADNKLTITGVKPGGSVAEGEMVVKVTTNNEKGYNLSLAPTDGTNMTGDGDDIPAGVPTANGANSAWGFKVSNPSSTDSNVAPGYENWKALLASEKIKNDTGAAAENDTTFVVFGVNAKSTQKPGTYSVDVTFTATAAN